MLSLIEERLGATLPPDIMFEEETTLRALVPLIKAGGGLGHARSVLIDAAKLATIDLPHQTEKVRAIPITRFIFFLFFFWFFFFFLLNAICFLCLLLIRSFEWWFVDSSSTCSFFSGAADAAAAGDDQVIVA